VENQSETAETVGFEPTVPLQELHLSRVVHSTGLCDVSQCDYHPTAFGGNEKPVTT